MKILDPPLLQSNSLHVFVLDGVHHEVHDALIAQLVELELVIQDLQIAK